MIPKKPEVLEIVENAIRDNFYNTPVDKYSYVISRYASPGMGRYETMDEPVRKRYQL